MKLHDVRIRKKQKSMHESAWTQRVSHWLRDMALSISRTKYIGQWQSDTPQVSELWGTPCRECAGTGRRPTRLVICNANRTFLTIYLSSDRYLERLPGSMYLYPDIIWKQIRKPSPSKDIWKGASGTNSGLCKLSGWHICYVLVLSCSKFLLHSIKSM